MDANAAAIATYNATLTGLRHALSQAEADAVGVLRDEASAITKELQEQGRALLQRRQKAESELAAVQAELRPVSDVWARLEGATSPGQPVYRRASGLIDIQADGTRPGSEPTPSSAADTQRGRRQSHERRAGQPTRYRPSCRRQIDESRRLAGKQPLPGRAG